MHHVEGRFDFEIVAANLFCDACRIGNVIHIASCALIGHLGEHKKRITELAGLDTPEKRKAEAQKLLDYGFNQFKGAVSGPLSDRVAVIHAGKLQFAGTPSQLCEQFGGGNLEKNISPNLVTALQYAKTVGSKVVGVVGRSMVRNVNIARNLGYLKAPEGVIISDKEIDKVPDDELVLLTTGSALALPDAGALRTQGVDLLLPKPYGYQNLMAAVRQLCGGGSFRPD